MGTFSTLPNGSQTKAIMPLMADINYGTRVVPFMKSRNSEELKLAYGFHYPDNVKDFTFEDADGNYHLVVNGKYTAVIPDRVAIHFDYYGNSDDVEPIIEEDPSWQEANGLRHRIMRDFW